MAKQKQPWWGGLFLAVTFVSTAAPAREHLGNGGFERRSAENGPEGWTVNGAPGLGGSFVWLKEEALAHSGQGCLRLTNDVPGKSEMAMMSPAFEVRPGRYDVQAAVRGTGRFSVYLYQYDATGRFLNSVAFSGDAPAEWQPFQWTYEPPPGVAQVAFALHAAGRIYFDDCSFRSVQAAESPAPSPEDRPAHFWTIPRTSTPPRIDGRIDDAAWSEAAATTGFTRTDTQTASAVQPVVQAAYDQTALYFAWVSPLLPGQPLTANVRGVGGAVWDDDDVEILLQPHPPEGAVYHFLGGPAGGYSAFRDGEVGHPRWAYRSGVTKEQWVAEFALPFAALEENTPPDGAVWGVNLGRGYAHPREWTAWAPTRVFADAQHFGRMCFGGPGPCVRVTSLGNLPSGNVHLQGLILAPDGTFIFSAGAGPRPTPPPEVMDPATVHTPARDELQLSEERIDAAHGRAPLQFTKKLEMKPARLVWEVSRAEKPLLLQKHHLDFDPLPPLTLTIHSSPVHGTVEVRLDAAGLYDPGSRLKGRVTLREKNEGREVRSKKAIFDGRQGKAVFDLAAIPVGDYRFTASVSTDQGKTAQGSADFSRAEPVPQAYSRLGWEPEVPAPWTPVVVEGQAVQVWNRVIVFGGNGLPSMVRSAGLEALVRPITLRAYQQGEEVGAATGRAAVARLSPGVAEAKGETRFPGLSIRARSRVEFDGCVRVDLELVSGRGDRPDHLVLDLPFTPAFAELIHSHVMNYEPTTSGAIPPGAGVVRIADCRLPIADCPDSGSGQSQIANRKSQIPSVVWSHSFAPVIWIGNTRAGLCWFAESQRDWALSSPDQPAQEIVREEDAVVLRVHLARRAFPPGAKRRLVFGLHPTPVKPLPANWRRIRMGAANPYLPEDPYFDTFVAEPGGKWWGWPEPKSDEQYQRMMDDIKSRKTPVQPGREPYSWPVIRESRDQAHASGGRLVWYAPLQMLALISPWYRTYGQDWALTYGSPYVNPQDPWWNAMPVCPAARPWQDLYIGTVHHSLAQYDFDGIYLDLFLPWRCANAVHGCGYTDEERQRHGEHTIWAMREQMKRLYRVVHARPNGYLIGHISAAFIPPLHGFIDTAVNGEQYWTHFHARGGTDYHAALPLDKCRTEVLGRQWGWIPLWLPQFKDISAATSRQMLSLILLHDSLVWPAYMDANEYHQANAILWRLGFVDAEFVGYFDAPPPAQANSPDVWVSAYKKCAGQEGRVILIITNHGPEAGRFQIAPNAAALGLPPGELRVTEYLDLQTQRPLACQEGTFEIDIPGRDYRIVSIRSL